MTRFLLLLGYSIGLSILSLYSANVHASPVCDEKKDVPEQYFRVIRGQLIERYPLTDPPNIVKKTNCDRLCEMLNVK